MDERGGAMEYMYLEMSLLRKLIIRGKLRGIRNRTLGEKAQARVANATITLVEGGGGGGG